MNNRASILNVLLGQLAQDDPVAFADVLDARSGLPEPPLVTMIRALVVQAENQVGKVAPRTRKRVNHVHDHKRDQADKVDSDDELAAEVWQSVARSAELLTRAAAALMLALVAKATDSEPAGPPAEVVTAEDGQDALGLYLTSLEGLESTLRRYPIDAMDVPVSARTKRELAALPTVFEFLAQRRGCLRALVHPQTGQGTFGKGLSAYGADRGDEILALYTTVVLGTELTDTPENWSLRNRPDMLRQSMCDVLCDLHHLADAAEINWKTILADGYESYREELVNGE